MAQWRATLAERVPADEVVELSVTSATTHEQDGDDRRDLPVDVGDARNGAMRG